MSDKIIPDDQGGFHLPDGGRLIPDGMGGFHILEGAGSGLSGLEILLTLIVVVGGLIAGIVWLTTQVTMWLIFHLWWLIIPTGLIIFVARVKKWRPGYLNSFIIGVVTATTGAMASLMVYAKLNVFTGYALTALAGVVPVAVMLPVGVTLFLITFLLWPKK